jgi:hypothetical protein
VRHERATEDDLGQFATLPDLPVHLRLAVDEFEAEPK